VDRAPLLFIGREEQLATPSLQHACKLPTEIDAVCDPKIHPKSAVGRMQVTCVAGQKNASVAIAVGDQAVCRPKVALENLDLHRAADSGVQAVDKFSIGYLLDAGRKQNSERPHAAAVEGTQHAGRLRIDSPIHDGTALRRS